MILTKQLCLTVLSEYILLSTTEWKALKVNLLYSE